MDLDAFRMIDREQAHVVEEQGLLELVRHPQLVSPLLRPELPRGQAHVFVGVGSVAHAGAQPIAHLASPQEVADESEARPIPGEEVGAGRGFAVELGDRQGGDSFP
jgi:hypothetical protein